jgi:cytochrome P450 family 4
LLFYTFQHPHVAQRLRTEIDEVIKSDTDITADSIKHLTYLDCVISETSRIFSSGAGIIEREFIADTVFGGAPVQKGTCVTAHWISLFHDPSTFERPLEFIPERWEREEAKQHQHLVSLVFSGGPRNCIGKYLALTELKVMVIKFFQRYSRLVEQDVGARKFEQHLTYHVANDTATLTKK